MILTVGALTDIFDRGVLGRSVTRIPVGNHAVLNLHGTGPLSVTFLGDDCFGIASLTIPTAELVGVKALGTHVPGLTTEESADDAELFPFPTLKTEALSGTCCQGLGLVCGSVAEIQERLLSLTNHTLNEYFSMGLFFHTSNMLTAVSNGVLHF